MSSYNLSPDDALKTHVQLPVLDVDFYSDESIRDPYPLYRRMRDLGPVIRLSRHDLFAVTRYADVRSLLRDFRSFSSAHGVAVDPAVNDLMASRTSLSSDPPLHEEIRKVTSAPLLPRALESLQANIQQTADSLVDELCTRKYFDGMRDLAQVLPLTIVSELVGLPSYGRDSMLRWAAATFNALGPMNQHGQNARSILTEYYDYCRSEAVPGKLRPGGWADALYGAARRGEFPIERCPGMIKEYIGPSLDTTIFATGHLIRLLGENPKQWDAIRANPDLIPGAINEALRIESPIRAFTRMTSTEVSVAGVPLPAGSRVLVVFASANRDERHWPEPDAYQVDRKADGHVAFGHGIHTCAGMHLARMEMTAIMRALVRRVSRIEVGQPTIAVNNVLRGYESLPVRFN